LVLSKWTAEIKKGDAWETVKLLRGSRRGFWNYSWETAPRDSQAIAPKLPIKMALAVVLPVVAPQMTRRRALHPSLPNPLEIKFTVGNVDGGTTSIVIPAKSTIASLDLNTREKEIANNGGGKTILGWAQCDDTEAVGRINAAIFFQARDGYENQWEIRQSLTNSYQTLTATELKKIGFKAAAEGKAESKLDSSSVTCNPGCSLNTYALVDVPRRRVYGIRFHLKTSTSESTASFLIKPPTPPAKTA
jgi:hypothetical protein